MSERLPPDLTLAASTLQSRFEILSVPKCRSVDEAEWKRLESLVGYSAPVWIRNLLQYKIIGGIIEYRDRKNAFQRLFRLFDPAELEMHLRPNSLVRELLSFGWYPLADESDGSIWVTPERSNGAEVYLLELSAWNGREPTISNGLLFAADRLSFLLCSMAISEASYYAHLPIPRSVMWYHSS